jgi:hypothetical protein
MLLDQLSNYKTGIVALQEIRWLGNETLEKQDGTLFYSCDGRIHAFGTGFIVHKQLKHLVIGFKAINPRLSTLKIKGKFFNYCIVNAHAPTEASADDEKDYFYDALERTYDDCPKMTSK